MNLSLALAMRLRPFQAPSFYRGTTMAPDVTLSS